MGLIFGIERDKNKARDWYERASKHGSKKADEWLDKWYAKIQEDSRRNLAEAKKVLNDLKKDLDNFGKSP